jgi:hypothetical protein
MFKPTAIANPMTVVLVAAASHVENKSKTTQNTDALKYLVLQELYKIGITPKKHLLSKAFLTKLINIIHFKKYITHKFLL